MLKTLLNNVNIYKSPCYGCGVCSFICPKKAISIKENKFGYFEPTIDDALCINCGLCKKVCTKDNKNISAISFLNKEVFSYKSKDDHVLEASSSGGFAHDLSKKLLGEGYYIYGVTYDLKTSRAIGVLVKNENDLLKLSSSKYIQANYSFSFNELIKSAKEGKKIAAFGTPCQIGGLRALVSCLKIEHNFIFIDFFCHGAPSNLVWDKYLEENKIIDICKANFRTKDISWQTPYYIKTESNNSTIFMSNSKNNDFYRIFFDNVLLNECCDNCFYRKHNSSADIRIGDFWGKRFIKDDSGVSIVVPVNEKGKTTINDYVDLVGPYDFNSSVAAQSTGAYNYSELREESFKYLFENHTLKETIKFYRKKWNFSKRIKIFIKESGKRIVSPNIALKIKRFIKK